MYQLTMKNNRTKCELTSLNYCVITDIIILQVPCSFMLVLLSNLSIFSDMGQNESKLNSGRRVTFAEEHSYDYGNGGHNSSYGNGYRSSSHTTVTHQEDTFDSYDAHPHSRETTGTSLGQEIQARAIETNLEDIEESPRVSGRTERVVITEGRSESPQPNGGYSREERVTTRSHSREPQSEGTFISEEEIEEKSGSPSTHSNAAYVREEIVTHSGSPQAQSRGGYVTNERIIERSGSSLLPSDDEFISEENVMTRTGSPHSHTAGEIISEETVTTDSYSRDHSPDLYQNVSKNEPAGQSRMKIKDSVYTYDNGTRETNVEEEQWSEAREPVLSQTRNTSRTFGYRYPRNSQTITKKAQVSKPVMSNELWGTTNQLLDPDRDTPAPQKSTHFVHGNNSKRTTVNLTFDEASKGETPNPLINSFALRKQYGRQVVQEHKDTWGRMRDRSNSDSLVYQDRDRPMYKLRANDKGRTPRGSSSERILRQQNKDAHIWRLKDETFVKGNTFNVNSKQLQSTSHGARGKTGSISFDSDGKPLPPGFDSDEDGNYNGQFVTHVKTHGPKKVYSKWNETLRTSEQSSQRSSVSGSKTSLRSNRSNRSQGSIGHTPLKRVVEEADHFSDNVNRYFDENGREIIREEIHLNGPSGRLAKDGYGGDVMETIKKGVHGGEPRSKTKKSIWMSAGRNASRVGPGHGTYGSKMSKFVESMIEEKERFFDEDGREVIREEVHLDGPNSQYNSGEVLRESTRKSVQVNRKPSTSHQVSMRTTATMNSSSSPAKGSKKFRQQRDVKGILKPGVNKQAKNWQDGSYHIDAEGREIIREEIHLNGKSSLPSLGTRSPGISATRNFRHGSNPRMSDLVNHIIQEKEHFVDEQGREIIREEVHLNGNASTRKQNMGQTERGPSSKFKRFQKPNLRNAKSYANHEKQRFSDESEREIIHEEVHLGSPFQTTQQGEESVYKQNRSHRPVEEVGKHVESEDEYEREVVKEEIHITGSNTGNYSGVRDNKSFFGEHDSQEQYSVDNTIRGNGQLGKSTTKTTSMSPRQRGTAQQSLMDNGMRQANSVFHFYHGDDEMHDDKGISGGEHDEYVSESFTSQNHY